MGFEEEIRAEFLKEASDLLESTEQCFLDLEKDPDNQDNLNRIFRLAHNLKGSSGAVGFQELAAFTHKLESLILAVKSKKIELSSDVSDLLLAANDYLKQVIGLLQEDPSQDKKNEELSQALVAALENRQTAATSAPQDVAAHAATETPSVMAEGSEPFAPALVKEEALATSEANPAVNTPAITASRGSVDKKPAEHAAAKKDDSIRVSLAKVEQLLNNIGELSIFHSVLTEQVLAKGQSPSILTRKTLDSVAKVLRETQSLSMGLRMLPIRPTFQKMQRIVRDTSKNLNKEIVLHVSGEDVEVDKTVLDQLGDPLVHLVRNALDHGIEPQADRIIDGKDPVGNVFLAASHRAGHMIIEVRDDGRGLDAEKLVSKAKAKGLIPATAELSNSEAYQLIFHPGFSTKEQVSDISGRGVGMDVVKTNIAALQGRIEIDTAVGKGTTFRVILPLTMAIIDGVVLKVGEKKLVVPLNQIVEFVQPEADSLTYAADRIEMLSVRDETFAAYKLAELMNIKMNKPVETIAQTALIVRNDEGLGVAIFVDRILGHQQVVIKQVGPEIRGRQGLMGSAILGDGNPALIIDLLDLCKNVLVVKKTNSSPHSKVEAA